MRGRLLCTAKCRNSAPLGDISAGHVGGSICLLPELEQQPGSTGSPGACEVWANHRAHVGTWAGVGHCFHRARPACAAPAAMLCASRQGRARGSKLVVAPAARLTLGLGCSTITITAGACVCVCALAAPGLQADSIASSAKLREERDFLRSLNEQLLANQVQLRAAADEARGQLAGRDAAIHELQEQVGANTGTSPMQALHPCCLHSQLYRCTPHTKVLQQKCSSSRWVRMQAPLPCRRSQPIWDPTHSPAPGASRCAWAWSRALRRASAGKPATVALCLSKCLCKGVCVSVCVCVRECILCSGQGA